nr:hypothetical protein [Tanacetum cinerariifolium]
RVDTSDDTLMEDVSNQERIIDELDKDEGAVLMNENKETEEDKDITGDAQLKGRHADIYQIDMDHAVIVLISAAAVVHTITTDVVPTVTAAPVKVAVPSTRRRRRVVIRDPDEESSVKTPTKTKSKDKGKGIMVEEPKPMKKKQQVELDEAYARKLHEELNQDIDWEVSIDHGMSYDDIRLIFEAKFNSNIEFLLKTKEQIEEEENRAIHLEFVPDEDDDVYTEATPLARKVPVVDYQIVHFNNKSHYKISRADETHQLYVSFITLLKNFDREDLESLWSIVKERFSTSKPNNFSDDFLLTTLRAMFGRPDGQDQSKIRTSKDLSEADVPLIRELEVVADEPMVGPIVDEIAEPIVKAKEQDDESEGFDEEEVWEVNEEWLKAPVTPHSMPAVPPPSIYEVGVIEDLSTRLGNLEYGHGQLVKKVIQVSDDEVAPDRFKQIGAQVKQGQQTATQRDKVIAGLTQQVQALQAAM